jgi:hypothetical protein
LRRRSSRSSFKNATSLRGSQQRSLTCRRCIWCERTSQCQRAARKRADPETSLCARSTQPHAHKSRSILFNLREMLVHTPFFVMDRFSRKFRFTNNSFSNVFQASIEREQWRRRGRHSNATLKREQQKARPKKHVLTGCSAAMGLSLRVSLPSALVWLRSVLRALNRPLRATTASAGHSERACKASIDREH